MVIGIVQKNTVVVVVVVVAVVAVVAVVVVVVVTKQKREKKFGLSNKIKKQKIIIYILMYSDLLIGVMCLLLLC